jgi:putative FmdB family regulatory protein
LENNMPLYDFECEKCGFRFDAILPEPRGAKCPACSGHGHYIPAFGGFRRTDFAPWVRDAAKVLDDGDSKAMRSIETPGELAAYCRAKSIVPRDHHPAFPSSMGDCFSRPDPAAERERFRRRAGRKLREVRSINIGF